MYSVTIFTFIGLCILINNTIFNDSSVRNPELYQKLSEYKGYRSIKIDSNE